MAEEIVSINNLKENILQFELTVEGLSTKDFDAKFVIHSSDMEMAFPCKKGDDGKWTVTLPPLPMLERTAYPFHLQVVAEGFQFRPLRGAVNVVGSPEVYATGVKNQKLKSPTKPAESAKVKTEAVVVPKAQPTKSREKPIEQIARELMEANKPAEVKPEAVVAPVIEAAKPVIEAAKPVIEAAKPVIEAAKPVESTQAREALLPTIKIEEKPESSAKDKAAMKVLEDLGLKAKKPKAKRRFSLKD
jgi:hypothetical protein